MYIEKNVIVWEHCEPKVNMSENRYIGAICFGLKGTGASGTGACTEHAYLLLPKI